MARKLLVAIMRDEAPYILEWVSHHRAVGFTDILVFTNNCRDGTDHILDRLMDLHLVVHCPNPKAVFSQISAWQVAALRYAARFGLYRRADWVMTVDADEFLEISVGDHTLDALLAESRFDVMSLPVLSYRSDADPGIRDGQVQDRFRQPRIEFAAEGWTPTPMAVKSLVRPSIPHHHFRNHRPKIDSFSTSGMVWQDGAGQVLSPAFTDHKINGWTFDAYPALAHVNHHSLRSRDSFLMKAMRGDAVTEARLGLETEKQFTNTVKYWSRRNSGDASLRQVARPPAALALDADLHRDPILAELHAAALAHHQQRIAALLDMPLGQLLAASMPL